MLCDVIHLVVSQDPKKADMMGRTALCDAAKRGHLDVVNHLVEKGVVCILSSNFECSTSLI